MGRNPLRRATSAAGPVEPRTESLQTVACKPPPGPGPAAPSDSLPQWLASLDTATLARATGRGYSA